MAVTIIVKWKDNGPCSNQKVVLWMDGTSSQEKYTGSDGKAVFEVKPGKGTVYCGNLQHEGNIGETFYITCENDGLHYKYS